MQKLRKVARAIFKAQRNRLQVWLLLDSRKPIHNHILVFTFDNVRHALNGGSPCRFGLPPHIIGLFILPSRLPRNLSISDSVVATHFVDQLLIKTEWKLSNKQQPAIRSFLVYKE